MNILITGAAGFIGSHVSEYYIHHGDTVIGIDNFDNYYPEHFKQLNIAGIKSNPLFHFYTADIRDGNNIDSIFSKHPVDLVIHLAAKAGVRPSIEHITDYYDVNMNGSIVLLEAMKKHNVKKLLFASSSSVYGNNPKVPFSESDRVDDPISPYASTKKSGELLCHVYSHLYGFDITCLRFFTVFGPRQRPDLAIHKFTRLIDNGMPIPFYGDGNTARDYTYIDDIVNGVTCAANHLSGYQLFNLGESRTISLKQLVESIEKAVGKKAILNRLPMQPGDVNITYADTTKARNGIGYNPQYNLDAGIVNFVTWYRQNKNLLYHS